MARKLTLLFTLAILTLFALFASTADASQIDYHRRMMKKRAVGDTNDGATAAAPDPSQVGVINTPADPNNPANPNPNPIPKPTGTGTSGTPTGTGTDTSVTPSNTGTAGQTTTPGGILPSISLPLVPNPVPSLNSSSTVESSSTTSSSSTSSTSSTPAATTPAPVTPTTTPEAALPNPVVTVTSFSSNTPSPSTTPAADTSATSSSGHIARNTIVSIAVVAACIGGAVIIWTVIRKWKLGTSDEFNDRLNPIDWQPTSSMSDPEMAQHRRTGSGGSGRSFGNMSSEHQFGGGNSNNMISDLPNHDFTAGGGGGGLRAAPIGGYADLHRGPSPTPSLGGYGATQYSRNGY